MADDRVSQMFGSVVIMVTENDSQSSISLSLIIGIVMQGLGSPVLNTIISLTPL